MTRIQQLVNDELDQQIASVHAAKAETEKTLSELDTIAKSVRVQRFWFNIFRIPVLILLPPLLAVMWLVTLPFPKSKHKAYHYFLQRLHQFGLWVLGMRVLVTNLNPTPLPTQVLFIGNADKSAPLVMQAHLPGDFRMVVRYDLFLSFKQFFVDYLMKKSLYLPVDPIHLRHLYADIRRMRGFLARGHRLAFAIRRSSDYQSPVFLLKHHPMPIVPVYVHFERSPNLANWTHPVEVHMVIGKPITLSKELLNDANQRNAVSQFIVEQVDALKGIAADV